MPSREFACFLAGIVGGAMMLVSILGFMEITPDMIFGSSIKASDYATMLSGFGGAITGAIIGGGISWLQAKQASSALRLDREVEKTYKTAASLMQVQLKTLALTNALYTLHRWIEDPIESARIKGDDVSVTWHFVMSTPSFLKVDKYNIEDFLPFVHPQGASLINEMSTLADKYDAAVNGANLYCEIRRNFQDFILPYSSLGSGGVAKAVFSEDTKRLVDLKSHELEQLLCSIRKNVADDVESGKALCGAIRNYANEIIEIDMPFINYNFAKVTSE